MKKMLLYVCAGVLALGLTACGGDKPEDSRAEDGSSQGTEQTGSLGENEGSEENGTESGNGSQDDVPESSEGEDVSSDTPESTDPGDDNESQGWSEEMAGLRAAAVEAVGEEEYWPDMAVDPELLEAFYGITSDMYDDYMAETPMISGNVDALIIVKAKEGQEDTVYDILNNYRENLVNDTMQYPQNLGKIQASQVEKTGSYVIFIQLGGYAIDSEDEEEVIALCQEANRKALEAIQAKLEQ